jgi:hypothetical protein
MPDAPTAGARKTLPIIAQKWQDRGGMRLAPRRPLT